MLDGFTSKEKKRLLVYLIIAVVLVVVIALIGSALMNKGASLDVADYPPSTLDKIKVASIYEKDERLSNTMSCPTLPYMVDVPAESKVVGEQYVYAKTNGNTFVMAELDSSISNNDALVLMNSVAGDYIEEPVIEWQNVIEDKGYANGYPAYYDTGHCITKTRMRTYHRYGVFYRLVTGGLEKDLGLYVCTDELTDLPRGKDLLDAVINTITVENTEEIIATEEEVEIDEDTEALVSESDTEEAGDVSSEEKLEEPVGSESSLEGSSKEFVRRAVAETDDPEVESIEYVESDDGGYGTISTDFNGVETYEKYKPFEVDTQYKKLCIEYHWENQAQPLSVEVIDPNGNIYQPDEFVDNQTWRTFTIDNNLLGKYLLHFKTREVLNNTTLTCMDLNAYLISNGYDPANQ